MHEAVCIGRKGVMRSCDDDTRCHTAESTVYCTFSVFNSCALFQRHCFAVSNC